MYTAFKVVFVCCFIVSGAVLAQLPAQKGVKGKGERPTTAPKGKTIVNEPEKTGETTLNRVDGGDPKKITSLPNPDYRIGLRGYSLDDGVVVMGHMKGKDFNQGGKERLPATEIEVVFRPGARPVKLIMESGDKITAIDGFRVKTVEEVVVAVNSAMNPHALDITWIDWRTGNEYTGKINAMKVRR